MNATATKPALLPISFLKKFLWISLTLWLSLNLLTISLNLLILSLFKRSSSNLSNVFFSWSLSLFFKSSIALTYLQILKESLNPTFMLLKSWRRAFSFNWLSLLSPKALSVIDLIVKFKVAKTYPTDLHFFVKNSSLVKFAHLLYIFFWPEAVVLINWITARFFKACPYSKSDLKGANVFLMKLLTNFSRPCWNLLGRSRSP